MNLPGVLLLHCHLRMGLLPRFLAPLPPSVHEIEPTSVLSPSHGPGNMFTRREQGTRNAAGGSTREWPGQGRRSPRRRSRRAVPFPSTGSPLEATPQRQVFALVGSWLRCDLAARVQRAEERPDARCTPTPARRLMRRYGSQPPAIPPFDGSATIPRREFASPGRSGNGTITRPWPNACPFTTSKTRSSGNCAQAAG